MAAPETANAILNAGWLAAAAVVATVVCLVWEWRRRPYRHLAEAALRASKQDAYAVSTHSEPSPDDLAGLARAVGPSGVDHSPQETEMEELCRVKVVRKNGHKRQD